MSEIWRECKANDKTDGENKKFPASAHQAADVDIANWETDHQDCRKNH